MVLQVYTTQHSQNTELEPSEAVISIQFSQSYNTQTQTGYGGSITSTVALRVIGGDEKGSLESGTVKYGCKSHRTQTRE
jgi:hypothetical protein